MHTTLYRKWRPSDFSSVVGQRHITDVLRYEIENNKTTHAYLFCGSRGTGKTTCAKILSKAINCLSPVKGNPCGKCSSCLSVEGGNAVDLIEMDAASNNGVDYIRDIREEVVYTPAALKKKVYIIDEVHMLSSSAFNALLKTLEEPPEHVVFILATTEFQKLPATVVSRCQRFDFKRISSDDIAERLEFIALKENISITHEAAKLIGKIAQGGMRDAISMLELCSGKGRTIDISLVNDTAGITGRETVQLIIQAVAAKNCTDIFKIISDFSSSSIDIPVFWQELISYYRDMLVIKSAAAPSELLDITEDELSSTKKLSSFFTKEKLLYHIHLLEDAYVLMQKSHSLKRICAEMTLVKMTDDRVSDNNDALIARISELEIKIASCTPNAPKSEINITNAAENTDNGPLTPKEPPKKEVPNNTQKSLYPLDCWNEIIEAISKNDMGLASTLRLTKCYFSDKSITIIAEKSFSKLHIETGNNLALIASAINSSGELSGISPSDICVIVSTDTPQKSDFLSDF